MWKRTWFLILITLGAASLVVCLASVAAGPKFYKLWWQSSEIVDHSFPLRQKWCFQADGNIRSTPVEYDGRIVARTNQDLYVLDTATGHLLWSVPLPKTWHAAPPIVHKGVIVVTHVDGTSAYDLSTGDRLWSATDGASTLNAFPPAVKDDLVVIVGRFIAGRNIRTGELVWHISHLYPRTNAIAAIDGDYLYVVFLDQIHAYDVATGELVWTTPTERWSRQSWLFQDGIWYLEGFEGGVSAFSIQEREVIWRTDDFDVGDYLMTKSGNGLLLGLTDGWPLAIDAVTGEVQWQAREVAYDTYQTPLVIGETVYVRSLRKKILYALDLKDGHIIGYLEVGRPVIASSNADFSLGPIEVDNSIVFAGDHRLCAYE